MLSYDDLRIRSNKIRPLRRNSADGRIIDLQQETSSITAASLAHAGELSAAEGMEWVGNPYKTHCCD